MTVAAVILAIHPDVALADADGLPRVRRAADAAWAGGAMPVVVVAPADDARFAAALAGAPVTLAAAGPGSGGLAGFVARGASVATAEVAGGSGVLVWPARWPWVGPETVTSLIEAHGVAPGIVLRAAYEGAPGWPALLPAAALATVGRVSPEAGPDALLDAAGAAHGSRTLELGDPGVTHDGSVARTDLPPYAGPPEPEPDHRHEWGAPAADTPDEAPVPGPVVAPYEPAADADA